LGYRWDLTGWVGYGYCVVHSRWCWPEAVPAHQREPGLELNCYVLTFTVTVPARGCRGRGWQARPGFGNAVVTAIMLDLIGLQPQVGTAGYCVDIGVWHPKISGRFALGIECDGRMYHSSAVARDRHRLRQEVLERLGWRIYRIWGTPWYRYRPEQEERLKAAIAAAISDTGDHPTAARQFCRGAGEFQAGAVIWNC
jgi:very-short-patch-repair endonuclease